MSMSYPGKNHVALCISCKILIDIEYQSSSINYEVMIKDEECVRTKSFKNQKESKFTGQQQVYKIKYWLSKPRYY